MFLRKAVLNVIFYDELTSHYVTKICIEQSAVGKFLFSLLRLRSKIYPGIHFAELNHHPRTLLLQIVFGNSSYQCVRHSLRVIKVSYYSSTNTPSSWSQFVIADHDIQWLCNNLIKIKIIPTAIGTDHQTSVCIINKRSGN